MVPGLYSLFLRRLCEIKSKKEIIPFPLVFSKICSNFSITKEECWIMLYFFQDMNFIEICPGHGIKILKKNIPEKREIKLFSHDIPKFCTSHCEKCGKTFDAKITIQDNCNDCSEKLNKEIEEKVKKEIESGNQNPEWTIKFQKLMEKKK
ncbi:MAG: hypothetical protein ABIH59_02910 [archaeon]